MKITAAILLALMTIAGPAQAYTVSKEVGPILQKVQALIAAKNYGAAAAKLNEAEAVKVTADDETVINQFRGAIVAAASDPRQPICTSAATGVTRCDGRQAIGVQP